MKLKESILSDAASIAAIRKDIHAHPELCFQEERTAEVVAQALQSWGIEVHRGIATTGILMRYVFKLDVVGVKQLMLGLVTFRPGTPCASASFTKSGTYLIFF